MVPSVVPSLAPTAPTAPPTFRPTAAPTVSPTATGADCTSYCAINGLGTMNPSSQTSYGPYVLTNYFTVTFSIIAPVAAPSGQYSNVFAITDSVTGAGLLSFWMTSSVAGRVMYNNADVVNFGSFFDASYASQYTTITITVAPSFITLTSDKTGQSIYSYTNVPTYGRAYYVSVSLPSYLSSAGTVRGMSITGMWISVLVVLLAVFDGFRVIL
jgi:hypothetical protein